MQIYQSRNQSLSFIFTTFLLAISAIEWVYLGMAIATISVIPLISLIFLLNKKNIYIISDTTLSIFSDNQKRMELEIEDLNFFSRHKNIIGQNTIVLVDSKSRQKYSFYLKNEEIEKFIANFPIS